VREKVLKEEGSSNVYPGPKLVQPFAFTREKEGRGSKKHMNSEAISKLI